MSYDQKCYDLAALFLADEPKIHTKHCDELAQLIQTTIEDYIRHEFNGEFALALSEPPQPTDWPADYKEIFWTTYPRRVGKADAMRKLEKIKKAGKVPFKVLIDAVTVYRAETQHKAMEYIAHPATWLNKGRWEDEPGAIAGSQGDGRGEVKNGFMGRLME